MAAFVLSDSALAPPGLGKVVSVSGALATVEYFHTPIDEPTLVTLPLAELREANVPSQTRAYWFDESLKAWRVGRIIDGEIGDIDGLHFHNSKGEARILRTCTQRGQKDGPGNAQAEPQACSHDRFHRSPLCRTGISNTQLPVNIKIMIPF